MTAFVALLRGVNVGKAKRLPMVELRQRVESLGGKQVATQLNSGNVVFYRSGATSAKIAAELAAALEENLGFNVPVVAKSASEFAVILKNNPLAHSAADHSRLLVAFAQDSAALPPLSALAALASPSEALVVGKHAAYLHCPAGIFESKVASALLGKTGAHITTRNWATCLKLGALLDGCGAA
jgi:uncharacterized protein (DUF1697 family)